MAILMNQACFTTSFKVCLAHETVTVIVTEILVVILHRETNMKIKNEIVNSFHPDIILFTQASSADD